MKILIQVDFYKTRWRNLSSNLNPFEPTGKIFRQVRMDLGSKIQKFPLNLPNLNLHLFEPAGKIFRQVRTDLGSKILKFPLNLPNLNLNPFEPAGKSMAVFKYECN